jgi:MOSC domain-containing protein YiiM
MQLVSVNVGQEQCIHNGKKTETSGIFKQPVVERVEITPLGLKGDTIIDTQHHGGPDQAVYVYGGADYDYWSGALGKVVLPGTFGDNLTISDLESAKFLIGDHLVIGPVILEVTCPRIPCATLAARMADPQFVKRFRYAERPGLYCRVIQAGLVQTGAAVTWEHYTGEAVLALELFRSFYEPQLSEAVLRHQLAAPIAVRARIEKETQLSKLLGNTAV